MAKATKKARAFAEYVKASFSNDGKYYLTYNITYVEIDRKEVQQGAIVVNCDLKDGLDLLRSKISDEVRNYAESLGLTIPNNGVIAQDFFKG